MKVARLGTKSLVPRRGQDYEDIRVAQIINHPSYNPPSSYNDIALLKLREKVQFSRNILPACLNNAFRVNVATKTLLALGWGKMDFAGPISNDLMKVDLRVVSNRECNRRYRESSRNKLPDGVKEEIQLCVGDDFQDTCQVGRLELMVMLITDQYFFKPSICNNIIARNHDLHHTEWFVNSSGRP